MCQCPGREKHAAQKEGGKSGPNCSSEVGAGVCISSRGYVQVLAVLLNRTGAEGDGEQAKEKRQVDPARDRTRVVRTTSAVTRKGNSKSVLTRATAAARTTRGGCLGGK